MKRLEIIIESKDKCPEDVKVEVHQGEVVAPALDCATSRVRRAPVPLDRTARKSLNLADLLEGEEVLHRHPPDINRT
jgi:hypothetical protein